ncbi:hypothetical protein [Flammeovirga pacifica]|uniref:Uncharacterized protein n=1 Tax=Flammeovirga pacifica TaxID=915059 RepID=A0A1S1YSD6_FLAPC|nr:hypothetical protein [Flammeovirga pacifica]OHX63944.1 hypothetical protein NH26_20250 [Flammeovirga pacifica]
MKKLLYVFALFFIAFNAQAQYEVQPSVSHQTQNNINIFNGLDMGMTPKQVAKTMEEKYNVSPDLYGVYQIMFLGEVVALKPVYDNHKLVKVELTLENSDIESIQKSLTMIEHSFIKNEDWKESKSSDDQWLFEKKLTQMVQHKNEIAVYTFGVQQNNIGSDWHAEIMISPRLVADKELDEEIVASNSLQISQLI